MQETKRLRNRLDYKKSAIIAFAFVFVRGPLFRIEDLTALGWDKLYAWRTVMSLVKAGILEKYDRTSYGATEETRAWFRNAFGGGVNDAAFAYSALAVQSWGESRLEYFKARLTEMWKLRPERFKVDMANPPSASSGEDWTILAKILCEKLDEAAYLCSLLGKAPKKEE